MSRIIWDGFDTYNNGGLDRSAMVPRWDDFAGAIAINAAAAAGATRFGTGCSISWLRNAWIKKAFTADGVLTVGMALKIQTATLDNPIGFAAWYDGVNPQITITLDPDGRISVRRGLDSDAAISQSSAIGLSSYLAWLWWEIKVAISNGAGTVDMWNDDGDHVVADTGLDTQATANATADTFVLASKDSTLTGAQPNMYADDMYANSGAGAAPLNGRLGDCRVYLSVPIANGTTVQFDPVGNPNNWQNVTGNDGDSTYNKTGTIGNRDLYVPGGIPSGFTGTIFGVAHTSRYRKDDAGVRKIAQVLKVGATTIVEAALSVRSTYQSITSFKDVSPDTGVAFTTTEINTGTQHGVELSA